MSQLLDVAIDTKVKLCALWTSVMFCTTQSGLFRLYVPGALEQMRAMAIIPEFYVAWIWVGIPILMIFLSVALPAKYNRILNIVVGGLIVLLVVFARFMTLTLVSKFGGSTPIPAREAAVSLEVASAAFAAIIVWYAWKWPKTQNAV